MRLWFDRAVMNFGAMVEEDVENYASKSKSEKASKAAAHRRLLVWLDWDNSMTSERFATPMVTKGG